MQRKQHLYGKIKREHDKAMILLDKPFMRLKKEEITKLPERERREYLVEKAKRRTAKAQLVVCALNQGVLDGVKTR